MFQFPHINPIYKGISYVEIEAMGHQLNYVSTPL